MVDQIAFKKNKTNKISPLPIKLKQKGAITNRSETNIYSDLELNQKNLINQKNCENLYQQQSQHKQFLDKKSTVSDMTIIQNQSMKNWNVAMKVNNIKKFFNQVKEQTLESNFDKLTKWHFNIINDKAYIPKEENHQNQNCLGLLKLLEHKSKKIPLFSIDNYPVILWKIIMLLILVFFMFAIPLYFSFQLDFTNDYAQILFFLIPIPVFILDILRNFNTGFYEDGIINEKRSDIFKYYASLPFGMFWIDIITTLSIILSQIVNINFLIFVFLLRVIRLNELAREIQEHFQLVQRFPKTLTLTRLMILIVVVAHLCGCGFHYIGYIDYNRGKLSWISQFEGASWSENYINVLYFSTITMITVGYGDIVPKSHNEKTYSIFMTLVSCAVFAYAVNTIGSIFQEISLKEANFKQQKYCITNYMRNRNINKYTQLKVLKYLDFIRLKEEEAPEKAQKILQIISQPLREEVKKDYFIRILRDTKYLFNNFSDQFLSALTFKMQEIIYGPGEIIYKENDKNSSGLYYLTKGHVELFVDKGHHIKLSSIKPSGTFGARSFFSSLRRETSAKSLSISYLVYVTQEDFLEVIREFHDDYESYCMMKDEIMLLSRSKIDQQCISCKGWSHPVVNCHLIHFKKNKDLLLKKFNYSLPQEDRNKQVRAINKKFQTLKQNHHVRANFKKFRLSKQKISLAVNKNYEIQIQTQKENKPSRDKQFLIATKKLAFIDNIIQPVSDQDEDEQSFCSEEIIENSENLSQEYFSYYSQNSNSQSSSSEEEESSKENSKSDKQQALKDQLSQINEVEEEHKSIIRNPDKITQFEFTDNYDVTGGEIKQFGVNNPLINKVSDQHRGSKDFSKRNSKDFTRKNSKDFTRKNSIDFTRKMSKDFQNRSCCFSASKQTAKKKSSNNILIVPEVSGSANKTQMRKENNKYRRRSSGLESAAEFQKRKTSLFNINIINNNFNSPQKINQENFLNETLKKDIEDTISNSFNKLQNQSLQQKLIQENSQNQQQSSHNQNQIQQQQSGHHSSGKNKKKMSIFKQPFNKMSLTNQQDLIQHLIQALQQQHIYQYDQKIVHNNNKIHINDFKNLNKDDCLFFYEMDKIKEFQIYFRSNNVSNVLKHFKRKQKKQLLMKIVQIQKQKQKKSYGNVNRNSSNVALLISPSKEFNEQNKISKKLSLKSVVNDSNSKSLQLNSIIKSSYNSINTAQINNNNNNYKDQNNENLNL